jgi:hypothetical protein
MRAIRQGGRSVRTNDLTGNASPEAIQTTLENRKEALMAKKKEKKKDKKKKDTKKKKKK